MSAPIIDWAPFIPSLLASLVAAGIGIFGVWYGFRLQRRASYEARLDDALALLIGSIPARLAQLDAHASVLAMYEEHVTEGGDPEVDLPLEPAPYELAVRIEAARMLARDDDTAVIAAMADAFHALPAVAALAQRARLTRLPEMIRLWRSEAWSNERARAEFDRFAKTAEAGTGFTPPPPWEQHS